MKNYAAIGTCPICSQGRLIIARDESSSELYVVCEECESEWATPEASKRIDAATRAAHEAEVTQGAKQRALEEGGRAA